jgi:hypothetical protein
MDEPSAGGAMIAFGCVVSDADSYVRYAEPGIELVREPDSRVYPFAAVGRAGRSFNLLLAAAARCEDLEALVIVHSHAQIDDRGFMAKVRAGLADPEVALLGCAGATGVRDLAWWKGTVSAGDVVHRYNELGGGDLPAYGWAAHSAPRPVEGVDPFLLVLSPWAVRTVGFDEELAFGYGVELDYCLQLRAAGRRLATLDTRVIEHRSLEFDREVQLWAEGHLALARKWEGRLPDGHGAPEDWERRARRAEAEREAMRAMAYARRLEYDARIETLQRTLDATMATRSWRVTAPLRELNLWRRNRAARAGERAAGAPAAQSPSTRRI